MVSPAAPTTAGRRPESVQPGGGWIMSLELAWGRLRRGWLRRVRPGYVRRMADKRQGECPNCPHDIIDPRDLKYVRNVCGYWFHPEDDPFRWRDRLGFARYGLAELILFSAISAVLSALFAVLIAVWGWVFSIPLAVVLLGWAEVVYFF